MRLKPHEKQFIEEYGHRVRARDLAIIMGRTFHAAKWLKRRYAPKKAGIRMSAQAAQLNLKRIKRCECEYTDLRFKYVRTDTAGLWWEEWQIAELRSDCCKKPLTTIARNIGKSFKATQKKAARLGLDPYAYSIRQLARRLLVPVSQIKDWTEDRSGYSTGHKVRWYRDHRRIMIHKDDAEWLLEHRDLARSGDFPDHPGKLEVGEYGDDKPNTQGDDGQCEVDI